MLPVVGDARQDLPGPWQRRAEPDVGQRQRIALVRKALEGRAQALETVDDALHRRLRRVTARHGVGDVDDPALGEHAGQDLARRRLEEYELHGFLTTRDYAAIASAAQHSCTLVMVVLGLILLLVGRVPWVGRLPGDIYVPLGNWSFYFPLATCLIVSVILTLLFSLFGRR